MPVLENGTFAFTTNHASKSPDRFTAVLHTFEIPCVVFSMRYDVNSSE